VRWGSVADVALGSSGVVVVVVAVGRQGWRERDDDYDYGLGTPGGNVGLVSCFLRVSSCLWW
jgi:hypothetical protein